MLEEDTGAHALTEHVLGLVNVERRKWCPRERMGEEWYREGGTAHHLHMVTMVVYSYTINLRNELQVDGIILYYWGVRRVGEAKWSVACGVGEAKCGVTRRVREAKFRSCARIQRIIKRLLEQLINLNRWTKWEVKNRLSLTPSVSHNFTYFDSARILRNLMESELKKLVGCGSYF